MRNNNILSCVIFSLFTLFFVVGVDSACQQLNYPILIHNNTDNAVNKSQVFKIGMVASLRAGRDFIWLVSQLAIAVLNNSTDILPDVRLELYAADVLLSDSNTVIATQYLINTIDVKAIVGGFATSETDVSNLFARIYSIPQVIPIASSTQFINYPFLARVIANEAQQATAIASFYESQSWDQTLVIYGDDDASTTGLELIKTAASTKNITVYSYQVITSSNYSQAVSDISDLVTKYRIRIFTHYEKMKVSEVFVPLFRAAGYGTSEYAHIYTFNQASYCAVYTAQYPWCAGSIGIIPQEGTGSLYQSYLKEWNKLANRPGWVTDPRLLWYIVDAILAVAHSLDNVMNKFGLPADQINGTVHMDAFKYLKFEGVTGNISLDSDLERIASLNWFNFGFNYTQSAVIPVATYDGFTKTTTVTKTIYFVDGVTSVLDGYCLCHFGTCNAADQCVCEPGWSGTTCNLKDDSSLSTTVIILVVVIPIILIVTVAIFGVRFLQVRKAKIIKDITDKQKSTIYRKDIQLDKAIGRGASGVVYKAMYRGTEVAVKRIIVHDVASSALQEFELESAVMAGLRHPNIVLFMGACMDTEAKEMLLVMEFLEKGSLHDILHNSKIQFSFEMALHVASQAAKGMNFLHQATPPIIHRDLKSHNILLDDKWNARIADFGITRMKDLTNTKKHKESNSLGTIFWTAPEVFEGNVNSEKSDCYSFGIVLWELMHRQNPYEGKDPMSVALDVCNKGLRPTVCATMVPEYEQLMRDCWSQLPDDRPSFQDITQRLRQITAKYSSVVGLGTLKTVEKDVEAPEGNVIFVQTEVLGGNTFWDQCPNDMLEAIQIHNQLVRHQMKTYEGYEVESGEINDSFLIAFEDLSNAINFCLSLQHSLLRTTWSNTINSFPLGSKVENNVGEVIWNGLRVRMAISSGVPNSEIDSQTGRTKYSGPAVQKVKKMLSSTPSDTSIVTSEIIADLINKNKLALGENVIVNHCGRIPDTTKTTLQTIYSVLPSILEARISTTTNGDNPYTLLDIDEIPEIPTPTDNSLSWIVPSSQLTVKENVGRGAVGDYYHALWDGKDIALKILINQKLEELDILNLKAKVSELSKIKHKNLTEINGVCFDENQISLITEYLPNSGLRALLSNESISISLFNKLKLVKQIADGMAFLSTFNDPAICVFGNLKSGNILVNTNTFEAKISDYGQEVLKDLGRTMTSVGTVAWTAPEILMGEEITPAISIYSFGIIMYEIVSRKMPYANEHPVKLVGKIIAGYRPSCGSEFPADYKELMEQCWNANPSERPEWNTISNQLSNMMNSAK